MNTKHKVFADEYLTNGRNATKAYLAVYKPKTSRVAEVSGGRLLRNVAVQSYIVTQDNENRKSKEISKEKYLKYMDSLVDKVDGKESIFADDKKLALDAIKIIGKWQGYESPTQVTIMSIKDVLKTQEDEETIDLD